MTEFADGSENYVNACGYYRLPADSYAAIDMGEPKATPAMHSVNSYSTTARTGGEIYLSNFLENTTTPSTQLCMNSEAMESVLILESTQPPTTRASSNEFMIHYKGTMDVAQPVPPSPGMDRNPSATLESSVVPVSSRLMTTQSTLTLTPKPSFLTGSTSILGRIQTKRMLSTSTSRRSWGT